MICIPTFLEYKVQLARVTVVKYNVLQKDHLVKMIVILIVCNFLSLSVICSDAFFVLLCVILFIIYVIMQEQIYERFPPRINITELVIHGSQIIIPTEHARVYADQLWPSLLIISRQRFIMCYCVSRFLLQMSYMSKMSLFNVCPHIGFCFRTIFTLVAFFWTRYAVMGVIWRGPLGDESVR